MGIGSEAKPELYQQTLGSSRRRRQGADPMPWRWLCPANGSTGAWGQWNTAALSQPGSACWPFPARRRCQEGKHYLLPFQAAAKESPLGQEQEGLAYCRCWPGLAGLPHGPSHCSSWQEPWASRGFDCNRTSHSCAQLRCSDMFSQVSFQGNSVLPQAMCFTPCFPKGRRGRSPQPPSEHLQLFKACGCNTTTGSHTHAKFLVLSSVLLSSAVLGNGLSHNFAFSIWYHDLIGWHTQEGFVSSLCSLPVWLQILLISSAGARAKQKYTGFYFSLIYNREKSPL